MSGRRLESGGTSIDRDAPVTFTFDGVGYRGFAGDTLASALLANGVDVVCPSPLQGRPRGIMSAGVEEPSAFVAVPEPTVDLITAATMVPLVDGLVAEGRPGVGRLSDGLGHAPHPVLPRHIHVETLVIGGGPAGCAAALAADDRVMLVTDGVVAGDAAADLRARAECTVLPHASALGIYDDGEVVVHERGSSLDRLWHVHAARVVLASGAHERPIAFANNDRPGVMLAGSALTYIKRYGVLPGERAVIFTTNDSTNAVADALTASGAEIVATADVREGWWISATEGDPSITHVTLTNGEESRTVEADLVAVSGGWNPAVALARAIGAGMRFDERIAAFVPDGTGPDWLQVVGAAAGVGLPEAAPYWFTPSEDLTHHYVDFQRDQTVADIIGSLDRGLRSVEHVKRATYIGTALDQGRTSGVVTAEIVNQVRQESLGAQGPTNARPPAVPVPFATLAGLHRGMLLDPVRRTPMHEWHEDHGAQFENVGQWHRAWYYPRDASEDMDTAVQREAAGVRSSAGLLDASTLGTIEVVGPDAAEFLDRMYAGRMSTLRVGRVRYGIMLGLDGMVMDDGTVTRLGDDRFFLTTTTGGAAKVMDHLEEFLQTEWPGLRVYCTSVTEQWATAALSGPRARDILKATGTDADLSAEAFPFMSFIDCTVAGIPARVSRISFTGELSFEISVASDQGLAMWSAITAAGASVGLVPYGTETMHLLRAEKGFVIVGQDTDGTVTADDLGLGWMVDMDKGDFIGRRSLDRPDMRRQDRKQFVGLLTQGPAVMLPEGAQLVEEDTGQIPMAMIGHVTSSYHSPNLGHSIALAMVESGRSRIGSTVYAPMASGTIAATVVEPVFLDPQGARRDG